MKILLRVLGLLAGFLAVAFFGAFVMGAYLAVTRWLVRDCVATIVFFFAALVALRSAAWLWAEEP